MSTDDAADERTDADDDSSGRTDVPDGDTATVAALDDRLVDLLAWVLDTETRARIYVYLRSNPASTSREVAEGTGLYPSTVREALAELNGDETVTRRKREAGGAGNNPYEYEAIPPADLVVDVIDRVEAELNTVYNLDERLAGRRGDEDPISITVDEHGESQTSGRSDSGPASGRAESGAASGRAESGAASGRAETGPASGRAETGPDAVCEECEPVGADDD